MDSLVKYGHVNRGFLGVEIQDLTPCLAQAFKLNSEQGALVSVVTPGSAAAEAGLQSGDVIVEFNGQPVQDASQLKLRVAETNPGAIVSVVIMRQGQKKTVSVTLKEESNIEGRAGTSRPKSGRSELVRYAPKIGTLVLVFMFN
jgi:S1-C subfamily serine protease